MDVTGGGIALSIGLVVLFVLVGGYFAASELALVSLRDSQVDRLAAQGRRGARVAALRRDTNRFLSAVQIGVTLAGFFSAAYGGSALAGPLGELIAGWGVPQALAGTIALVAVTAVISYLSLVLGELVPKRLALQRSEGVALFVAPVLDRIATISRPVIWLLSRSTNAVVRLLGLDPTADSERVSEAELRDMVSGHEELDTDERRVLTDVFEASDRQVSEVMVPRTEVHFLHASTSLAEAARDVVDRPHSRYPVTGTDVDDVRGFVHVRDLLTARLDDASGTDGRTVGDIMRPVHVLPGSKALLPTLSEMRARRAHLAVVIDEYGGTDGILTMEDLIEELVGEIEDEYDAAPSASGPGSDRTVDGLLHRDDVHDRTGLTLPDGPFETLGGYLQHTLGRIPTVGDHVDLDGHRLTVAELDGRRVAGVTVVESAQP
ncbi:hemolysin family protein [Pseudonocardia sp. HH130630-07]|uniref:hemolysin family protein n=1 Tax=Pseudonocardia sp. HH130630-07 TaxID=1690815 RepID=UPI0008151BF4|nr:hemolysin family protein [Pseudonocardia sp. HH130630-07]ANY09953.1 hypothetical protein AFB00_10465 [Pseudonocardia sp. HH130630-07]